METDEERVEEVDDWGGEYTVGSGDEADGNAGDTGDVDEEVEGNIFSEGQATINERGGGGWMDVEVEGEIGTLALLVGVQGDSGNGPRGESG